MMKYLLVLLVVAIGVFVLTSRSRRSPPPPEARPTSRKAGAAPAAMLACARCGVHLPQEEVLRDSQGHAYCGEAHRLAGPQ